MSTSNISRQFEQAKLIFMMFGCYAAVYAGSALRTTARQYGEVVLPDAASGQGLGTPSTRGQKVVTVQGGYGALFAVMVQILLSTGAIAVQI